MTQREAFERFWVETRGKKKARYELQRHPLQPDTYRTDSANRHWVTYQAAQAAQPVGKVVAEREALSAALADCRKRYSDLDHVRANYAAQAAHPAEYKLVPIALLERALQAISAAVFGTDTYKLSSRGDFASAVEKEIHAVLQSGALDVQP